MSLLTPQHCRTTWVLLFHADILPRHHSYVGHLKSMCCPMICCHAVTSPPRFRGTSMLLWGGMDTGWKPCGSAIDQKLSLLSDDIFECRFKAQSSKLELLFCYVPVKRRSSFMLWALKELFGNVTEVGFAVPFVSSCLIQWRLPRGREGCQGEEVK